MRDKKLRKISSYLTDILNSNWFTKTMMPITPMHRSKPKFLNRCGALIRCLAWFLVIALLHLDMSIGDGGNLYVRTSVANYRPVFKVVRDKDAHLLVAIRSFSLGDEQKLLLVDPYTFKTHVQNERDTVLCNEEQKLALNRAPYFRALKIYSSPPYKTTNYGLSHAQTSRDGVFLTADLCPSSKPFDKDFFNALIKRKKKNLSIALTGTWALEHPQEFAWLIEQNNSHRLNILWINHTFHHRYQRPIPGITRDILHPKSALKKEILVVEQLLLEKGQTPSVFLRFPALISDSDSVAMVKDLGLITVGSDAWLAKGQMPTKGSIMLVHGNGNEPKGIKMFMHLFNRYPNMKFLPLTDALVSETGMSLVNERCGLTKPN